MKTKIFFDGLKNKKFLKNKIFVNLSTVSVFIKKFYKFAKSCDSEWIECPTLGNRVFGK